MIRRFCNDNDRNLIFMSVNILLCKFYVYIGMYLYVVSFKTYSCGYIIWKTTVLVKYFINILLKI